MLQNTLFYFGEGNISVSFIWFGIWINLRNKIKKKKNFKKILINRRFYLFIFIFIFISNKFKWEWWEEFFNVYFGMAFNEKKKIWRLKFVFYFFFQTKSSNFEPIATAVLNFFFFKCHFIYYFIFRLLLILFLFLFCFLLHRKATHKHSKLIKETKRERERETAEKI